MRTQYNFANERIQELIDLLCEARGVAQTRLTAHQISATVRCDCGMCNDARILIGKLDGEIVRAEASR